jgi:hypothetical protein
VAEGAAEGGAAARAWAKVWGEWGRLPEVAVALDSDRLQHNRKLLDLTIGAVFKEGGQYNPLMARIRFFGDEG